MTYDRIAIDSSITAAGASSPWWIHWLDLAKDGLGYYTAIGAGILITIRLVIAVRELFFKDKSDD